MSVSAIGLLCRIVSILSLSYSDQNQVSIELSTPYFIDSDGANARSLQTH